ncbi:hypothetical protein C922_04464 [Plasmodium inui San Antonio 1]|uniref:Uncharacterized protein n=1 Tax=Plasmodium inui San Antonio 1 TaxID=1237626 RepID=W7A1F7_9APIC|nr:hypothetical protein C922_04464 [Plasmodium inui San Antonio 1]EUD65178.1 hypothetical protein C922_04464 [Plasmodium inui San Antonio 1]
MDDGSQRESSNEGTFENEKKKKKKKKKKHTYSVITEVNYSQNEDNKSTKKPSKKKKETKRKKVHIEDVQRVGDFNGDASSDEWGRNNRAQDGQDPQRRGCIDSQKRDVDCLLKIRREKTRKREKHRNHSSNRSGNRGSQDGDSHNSDSEHQVLLLQGEKSNGKLEATTAPSRPLHHREATRKSRREDAPFDMVHTPQISNSPRNGNYEERPQGHRHSSQDRGGRNGRVKVVLPVVDPIYNVSSADMHDLGSGDMHNVGSGDMHDVSSGDPHEVSGADPHEVSSADPPSASSSEVNIFSKLLYKIRKAFVDRRGQPITNENVVDSDMCELTIVGSNGIDPSGPNNIVQLVEDEDTFIMQGHGTSQTGRRGEDRVDAYRHGSTRTNEMITLNGLNLNGLNPNDLLNSSGLINASPSEINEIFSNVENGIIIMERPDSGTNDTTSDEEALERGGGSHNGRGSDDGRRTHRFSYSNVSNRIATYVKENISYVKEKIKSYWLERVREANTQLATPHQTTNEREEADERSVHPEDENDDPSCLQVLFFLGLVCKFPILWIIGSIVFCITPNEHKKTKMWSLVNTMFALISVVYFISTSKLKMPKPAFFVLMESNTEEKNNILPRGVLKNRDNVFHSSVVLDGSTTSHWMGQNSPAVFSAEGKFFLNWNFVSTQKPDTHVLLSTDVYKLLNRVQVTFLFGRGNSYPRAQVEKMKPFFHDLKEGLRPVPVERLTMTDQDIPEDFFGGGLRCERTEKYAPKQANKAGMEKQKEKKKEKAKWYLFWKEDDNSKDNKSIGSEEGADVSLPVGEIFFFKSQYSCRVAFIYPKKTNPDEKEMPANFIQINKIIIKAF